MASHYHHCEGKGRGERGERERGEERRERRKGRKREMGEERAISYHYFLCFIVSSITELENSTQT